MKYIVLLMLATTIMSSCRREPQPIRIAYLGQYEIVAEEWVAHGEKQLGLQIATADSFNCTNFRVVTTTYGTGNEITLRLDGVLANQACHNGRDVARATPSFPNLPDGTYTLIVQNGDKEVRGTMTLAADRITIDYPGGNNVTFKQRVLLRVPKNAIWGTIEYPDSAAIPLVNDFIDTLLANGATAYTGDTGKYSAFTVVPGNSFVQPGDQYRAMPYRHIIYNYSGTTPELGKVVERFIALHNHAIAITINTWDGNVFGSYTPM